MTSFEERCEREDEEDRLVTNDPVSNQYVPAYADEQQEAARLERCLQQQIEDCFTTITRIQHIDNSQRWKTLRGGLRCWRAAIRGV